MISVGSAVTQAQVDTAVSLDCRGIADSVVRVTQVNRGTAVSVVYLATVVTQAIQVIRV